MYLCIYVFIYIIFFFLRGEGGLLSEYYGISDKRSVDSYQTLK